MGKSNKNISTQQITNYKRRTIHVMQFPLDFKHKQQESYDLNLQ